MCDEEMRKKGTFLAFSMLGNTNVKFLITHQLIYITINFRIFKFDLAQFRQCLECFFLYGILIF